MKTKDKLMLGLLIILSVIIGGVFIYVVTEIHAHDNPVISITEREPSEGPRYALVEIIDRQKEQHEDDYNYHLQFIEPHYEETVWLRSPELFSIGELALLVETDEQTAYLVDFI